MRKKAFEWAREGSGVRCVVATGVAFGAAEEPFGTRYRERLPGRDGAKTREESKRSKTTAAKSARSTATEVQTRRRRSRSACQSTPCQRKVPMIFTGVSATVNEKLFL